MIEGVGRERRLNRRSPSGIGYLLVPSDEDRNKYVETCFRRERVSIQLENGGGIIKDCYVFTHIMKELIFPEKAGMLGSCVHFVNDEYHSIPIIDGVISKVDESQLLQEGIEKRTVSSKEGKVNVEMNGKNGEMFINVDSDFENGGSVYINLRSKNNTSKFNVNCFGDVNIYSEGETTLETLKLATIQCSYIDGPEKKVASIINLNQDGFIYNDKNGNSVGIMGEEINILPKSILKVFKGGSPMVLGDELKKQLNVVTDRIENIRTSLKSVDPTGKITAWLALVNGILESQTENENFDNINSTKSFTD